TESQYQREYTSDEASARDRRDAYSLLFTANSVLFVGTALRDDDVLRPMRQFVSDNDIASRHRPWFALLTLPKAEERRRNELFHRYYYRYGIRAIFVMYDSGDDRGTALINEIDKIQQGWTVYRRERTTLPRVREPQFRRIKWDLDHKHTIVIHHATV